MAEAADQRGQAEAVTMSRDTFVWSMTNVPAGTASQFSVTIHLPRIEGALPEIGSAKWC